MSKKIIRTISWPLIAINAISALVLVVAGILAASGRHDEEGSANQQFMFNGINKALADTPHSCGDTNPTSPSGGGYEYPMSGGGGGVCTNCVGGCSNCDGSSAGSDSSGESK